MSDQGAADSADLYARGRADWARGRPSVDLQVHSAAYRRGLQEQRTADADAALLATVGVLVPPSDHEAAVDYLKAHHPAGDMDELERLALRVDAGAVALLTTALAGELPGAAEVAEWYGLRAALFVHRASASSAHAEALPDVVGDWQRAALRHRDSAISAFNQLHAGYPAAPPAL